MKTIYLTITFLVSVHLSCFAIAPEWNKEIQTESEEPGGTPVKGVMNLAGIGAIINKREGKCVVTKLVDGSGAKEAGIQVSDIITQIDAKDVSSLELLDIATLLRGDPDTKVVLTIVRDGGSEPKKITVTRRPVVLK